MKKKIIKTFKTLGKFFIKNKKEIMKTCAALKKIWLPLILCILVLNSCNMTRNITNTAQTIQKGDTTQIIQTKTTEIVTLKIDKQ